jgi:hypothetical protein
MSTKARRNRAKKNRAKASLGRALAEPRTIEGLASASVLREESVATSAPPAGETTGSGPSSGSRISDLDGHFFQSSPSEAWLAHELELRDPRFVRKMTASVARRRAHLARYVVGVLAVAAALGLAALLKLAVVP